MTNADWIRMGILILLGVLAIEGVFLATQLQIIAWQLGAN